jgi:glutamine amidotransferase
MGKLKQKYPSKPKNWQRVFNYMAKLCKQLDEFGVFNVLISDGIHILAYCSNNLTWITRKAPFGQAKLIDKDMEVNFSEVTTDNDIVTVIATRPLTDNENWTILKPKQWVLFKQGELYWGNY